MKYYTCPKCGNKTLCSTENEIDFHTLCICEECASELYAEEQYDGSVKFVEMTEEELEEERYNRIMNMSWKIDQRLCNKTTALSCCCHNSSRTI